MPRGDGTGPNGQGPMTGRRMGYCVGNDRPGFMEPGFRGGGGFGRGRGFGRGFGWRARFFQPQVMPIQQIQPQVVPVQPKAITETEEKQYLEQELKFLKEEMKEIEERIKELTKKK